MAHLPCGRDGGRGEPKASAQAPTAADSGARLLGMSLGMIELLLMARAAIFRGAF